MLRRRKSSYSRRSRGSWEMFHTLCDLFLQLSRGRRFLISESSDSMFCWEGLALIVLGVPGLPLQNWDADATWGSYLWWFRYFSQAVEHCLSVLCWGWLSSSALNSWTPQTKKPAQLDFLIDCSITASL